MEIKTVKREFEKQTDKDINTNDKKLFKYISRKKPVGELVGLLDHQELTGAN